MFTGRALPIKTNWKHIQIMLNSLSNMCGSCNSSSLGHNIQPILGWLQLKMNNYSKLLFISISTLSIIEWGPRGSFWILTGTGWRLKTLPRGRRNWYVDLLVIHPSLFWDFRRQGDEFVLQIDEITSKIDEIASIKKEDVTFENTIQVLIRTLKFK